MKNWNENKLVNVSNWDLQKTKENVDKILKEKGGVFL